MALTRRQAEILAYITEHIQARGYAPTLQEIGSRFGLSSVATVHKHLSHLVEKGYLQRGRNRRRDLTLVGPAAEATCRVPLLGKVAAGRPIEPFTVNDDVTLPEDWLGRGRTFALRVSGESMIDEQIRDGDIVIVEERETAHNGETVIALVEGQTVTVKQYQRHGAMVRLVPANPQVAVLEIPEERVRIQGVVIGVMRRL
ncbi:MAG: transcriptional repressor LexA [bacterium]